MGNAESMDVVMEATRGFTLEDLKNSLKQAKDTFEKVREGLDTLNGAIEDFNLFAKIDEDSKYHQNVCFHCTEQQILLMNEVRTYLVATLYEYRYRAARCESEADLKRIAEDLSNTLRTKTAVYLECKHIFETNCEPSWMSWAREHRWELATTAVVVAASGVGACAYAYNTQRAQKTALLAKTYWYVIFGSALVARKCVVDANTLSKKQVQDYLAEKSHPFADSKELLELFLSLHLLANKAQDFIDTLRGWEERLSAVRPFQKVTFFG
jgi:hypothetical protein